MASSIVLIDSTVGITKNIDYSRSCVITGHIRKDVVTPLKYFNALGAKRINWNKVFRIRPICIWSNKNFGHTLLQPLKINAHNVNPLTYSDYPKPRYNRSYESVVTPSDNALFLDQLTYAETHWDIIFKGITVWTVKNLENNININNPFFINVLPPNKVPEDLAVMQPLKILVEKTRPPSFGVTGSGSSIKNLKYSIQKNSFIEIFFNFEQATIINVQGLPQGLEFDYRYNKLFGTCELAGNFLVAFHMSNNNILEASIIVTNIPRKK